MRLLMRADSHLTLENSGLEVASSPDTTGREAWQWHLRLDEPSTEEGPSTGANTVHTTLARGDGSTSNVALSTEPTRVTGQIETLEPSGPTQLSRDERELITMVIGSGRVLVEGRHELGELDVLVLEGDDPFEVTIDPLEGGPVALAVARLDPVDSARIVWVP